jgi:hypothetical protein
MAIQTALSDAGFDPADVRCEPLDNGMFQLGADDNPVCLLAAGDVCLIKVGATSWMTLTRYVIEYWPPPGSAVCLPLLALPAHARTRTPHLFPDR